MNVTKNELTRLSSLLNGRAERIGTNTLQFCWLSFEESNCPATFLDGMGGLCQSVCGDACTSAYN